MEIEVTARSDGIPDRAKDYAREKLAGIGRFFDRIGRVHVSLEQAKDDAKAHAVAHLDTGSTLVADSVNAELRVAIDLLTEKLERQARREKERLIGRGRKSPPGSDGSPVDGSDSEPSYDDVIRDNLEGD